VSGQRKALIVANDEYEQEGLQNLAAPAADAEALSRVLADPEIGAFAVQVARNEPAHVVQSRIEDLFADSRPGDVLLLHFSGHGLKSESGELFFAAPNTRPARLGSTAIPADFVQRCIRDSRSRSIVLLLDCCYGGAFAQGVRVRASGDLNILDSFPQEKSHGGRGRAVITASSSMGYAFEGDPQSGDRPQPSVFTAALVEGLATGDADRDEDGWVSLNELYDYVFDRVRERNPHQTPNRQVELQGELYLARSRHRRIQAAPIPADLHNAMTDQNMYTRLGAVGELRSRLMSGDLPAAVGAHEALTELARNDVQYVADPAAEALRGAAVHPAEKELHFGRIEPDSVPPHRTVQLLGPPIARACVPRPSHGWIRVDGTADGLDISIDTTYNGALRGSVALKGPTGETTIGVEVHIVPPPRPPGPAPLPQAEPRVPPLPPIPPPLEADPPPAADSGAPADSNWQLNAPSVDTGWPPTKGDTTGSARLPSRVGMRWSLAGIGVIAAVAVIYLIIAGASDSPSGRPRSTSVISSHKPTPQPSPSGPTAADLKLAGLIPVTVSSNNSCAPKKNPEFGATAEINCSGAPNIPTSIVNYYLFASSADLTSAYGDFLNQFADTAENSGNCGNEFTTFSPPCEAGYSFANSTEGGRVVEYDYQGSPDISCTDTQDLLLVDMNGPNGLDLLKWWTNDGWIFMNR